MPTRFWRPDFQAVNAKESTLGQKGCEKSCTVKAIRGSVRLPGSTEDLAYRQFVSASLSLLGGIVFFAISIWPEMVRFQAFCLKKRGGPYWFKPKSASRRMRTWCGLLSASNRARPCTKENATENAQRRRPNVVSSGELRI